MDPPSGAPLSLDPCPSQELISQSDSAELLGIDLPFRSSHRAMISRDLSYPRTPAVPIQPVPEISAAEQPRDASSVSSAPDIKPFAEKSQRNTTPSPAKKSHHSGLGDSKVSIQNKSMQSNRPSLQNRAVQWVRVTPQAQAAQKPCNRGTEETGGMATQGPKECAGTASLSTEVLQKQGAEEIKVSDECVVGSFSEGLESKSAEPLPSSITSHHSDAAPRLAKESALQQAVEDLDKADAAEDPGTLCEDHQAAECQELFKSVVHEAEEQLLPSSTSTVVVEDGQTSEPQQKSLSRTSSSLSARAREFVPMGASAPPPPPPMPSQMHNSVLPPPLMMPLNSAPGILSMFPPSSPLPSPQLGGFPLPMVGPPPPPIPASLMGPMPLLGSPRPHPGLLSVQLPGPPPPPIIPQPAYMIHSPSSTGHPHLPTVTLMEPILNPVVKPNAEEVQDPHQSHDSDPTSVHPGGTKPVMTEELKEKIVKQVEFYFSDANLPTDHHLMKFVKKDPEGFVPIAVVANFRKVRNLMKNYALVATALRSSKQLAVSQDGKKVRRLHPLPHVDLEEIQSRTVVAENLPADHSIEAMEQLFSNVGNVKVVRVCEPEASNGSSQTAKFSKADMVVSNKLHALVEFESVEQAERAVLELTDQRNWRSGLHVRLLLRRTSKHSAGKSHKVNEGADGSTAEDDATPSSSDNFTERVGEEGHLQDRSDEPPGGDNSQIDGSSKKGRGRGRGRGGRGRGQYHPNGGRSHPVGTPPQANSLLNIEAKPPLGPRMPDGTRGFTLGRGKVITTSLV